MKRDPGVSDFELSELVRGALRLQGQWLNQGLEFCFIGGMAVQVWGESRLTQDVDVTIASQFGDERRLSSVLLENLSPRIEDAVSFATINRVLLAQDQQGVSIDISLAAMPFELSIIQRATYESIFDLEPLRVCTASDLIVLKAFANRPRDWEDIRGILIRSQKLISKSEILEELTPLADLKEEPEIIHRLNELFDEHL